MRQLQRLEASLLQIQEVLEAFAFQQMGEEVAESYLHNKMLFTNASWHIKHVHHKDAVDTEVCGTLYGCFSLHQTLT